MKHAFTSLASSALLLLATVSLLLLAGCDDSAEGYFYVANTQTGYVVKIDSSNNISRTVTSPMRSLDEAHQIANYLNRDLAGHVIPEPTNR